MGFRSGYDAFDRFQQRHAWLGFPLAVRQKYSDDQGGYLAATITYYAFFSAGTGISSSRSSTRRSRSCRSSATT